MQVTSLAGPYPLGSHQYVPEFPRAAVATMPEGMALSGGRNKKLPRTHRCCLSLFSLASLASLTAKPLYGPFMVELFAAGLVSAGLRR